MPGHECYHCKQWVEEGEAHDCWTTTERALTRDLSEDLRDAWERLREAASELGEQRIYASHNSIMFARKTKVAHIIQVKHRDEVEAPLTEWLHEAFHLQDAAAAKPVIAKKPVTAKKPPAAKKPSLRKPLPRAARTRRPATARRRG